MTVDNLQEFLLNNICSFNSDLSGGRLVGLSGTSIIVEDIGLELSLSSDISGVNMPRDRSVDQNMRVMLKA